VKLGGEYEKIKGNQDPGINDGRVVTSVEVPSQDGLILLRGSRVLVVQSFVMVVFARFTMPAARKRGIAFSFMIALLPAIQRR
jgi:hypothetical protein